MAAQLSSLYWLYRGSPFLMAILLLVGLVFWRAPALGKSFAGPVALRPVKALWDLLPIALLGLAFAHFCLYLASPSFSDYGEPVIPLLAGNVLNGGPVYSDWHSGQSVVGSNYGPYVFILQAAAIAWRPSILMSKLVGVVFALAALCLLYLSVRRRLPAPQALTVCALMVALLSFQLHYWFWNRPDTMLIALVGLGLVVYDRSRPDTCLIWLGLVAGLSVNLKLFGAIYLIPIALAALVASPWSARLVTAIAAGGALFVLALGLPFLVPSIDVRNYIGNILMMPKQGVDAPAVLQSVLYGCLLLAPPGALFLRARSSFPTKVMAISLVVSMAVVALLSAKPGGGPPYMMPFAPLCLYLAARLWEETTGEQRMQATQLQQAILAILFVCVLPVWGYSWLQMGKQVFARPGEHAKSAELRGLFAVYPQAEMGHGIGPGDSRDEFYRVQKAFLGQVTRFDYVNYADQRGAGLPVAVVYPLFENCSVPHWILAHSSGQFDGLGYGQPLFDEKVRSLFRDNYELSRQGQYYDVWSCKTRQATDLARAG